MSDGAQIQAIEALREFESCLRGFADEAEHLLIAIQREIQRTLGWLDEEITCYWWQVDRCEQEVQACRDALANGTDDGNSEDAEAELWHAEARLDEAKSRLLNARRWHDRVQRAVEEYRKQEVEVHRLVAARIQQACAFLKSRYATLYEYANVGTYLPTTAIPHGGSSSSLSTGARGPSISGFDKSRVLSNSDVTAFAANKIPVGHLRGLTRIQYADRAKKDALGCWVYGVHISYDGEAEIVVYRHPDQPTGMRAEMELTIAHEVGHNAFKTVVEGREAESVWQKIYQDSGHREFVGERAKCSAHEDFAESYAYYIVYPELLRDVSPRKYEFLRNNVFHGKEYL